MDTSTTAAVQKETLPLKDDLLDSKIKSDAMAACLSILDKLRSKEGPTVREALPSRHAAPGSRDARPGCTLRSRDEWPPAHPTLGHQLPLDAWLHLHSATAVLENTRGLAQAMETAMKLRLMRLASRRTDGRVARGFVDCLSPLIYRDQRVFLQALRKTVVLYKVPANLPDRTPSATSQGVFVELRSRKARSPLPPMTRRRTRARSRRAQCQEA